MFIDEEQAAVEKDDLIHVPPCSAQRIENIEVELNI